VVFASAWYGYRKYADRAPWRVFLVVFLLVLCGAAVGFLLGNLIRQRSLADIHPERAARMLAAMLLLGLVLAGTLVGIARLRLREVTQKAATLQAELKLLQAQVEPHFLFNTLANLRQLVQTGSRDALPMLDHLIQYLRTALPELRAESSTVGREAQLARAYLEIMRLRMGGALEVAVDVPAELAQVPFPPLLLITLVENAIKHGVAPVGRGRIGVRAEERDGSVRVLVEDDGRGLAEPIGRGVGLNNVRERLRGLYGDAARLELRGRVPSGTVATIELPSR
jgi:LytS/YehU family sensor histidine kinase